jgi:hypothetical protein
LSANNVFGYNNSVDRAQRFHGIVESFYLWIIFYSCLCDKFQ